MVQPIIIPDKQTRAEGQPPVAAAGQSFEIHEWRGSGPGYLHVHHSDDEAWHVLEGSLTFRFGDGKVEASAGTTVFVPAGVPHAYEAAGGPTRYLIVLTPRLRALIAALQRAPREEHDAIMRQFDSEVLE